MGSAILEWLISQSNASHNAFVSQDVYKLRLKLSNDISVIGLSKEDAPEGLLLSIYIINKGFVPRSTDE